MFGKKKAVVPVSQILMRMNAEESNPCKVSDYELRFFICFERAIVEAGLSVSNFYTKRMGDQTIRLFYRPRAIIGMINLREKIGSIQYYISDLDIHDMKDAPIEAIIAVIPYWIDYTKKCTKIRKAALSV